LHGREAHGGAGALAFIAAHMLLPVKATARMRAALLLVLDVGAAEEGEAVRAAVATERSGICR